MTFVSAIPDGATLATYLVACLILFVTPGPDMSLFLARTVAGGRRAGVAAALGANFGCFVHSLLAAVGLSAVIYASPLAFTAMKVVGALYLLWLAYSAIRYGSALNVRAEAGRPISFVRTFLLGLTVNLANPKVVLFFVTFLPQFVQASDPDAAGKLFFLGLMFVAVSIPLSILMVFGAERVLAGLRERPSIMRAIDYLFAGMFGAFALKILTTQGK